VAAPVLLISSDPFLGASLEAIARGRLHVARLDPSRPPTAWPAGPTATVVLDVTARSRQALHGWVRRHHPGLVVVVLKPGERHPALPPDPNLLVVARPFRVRALVALLERQPTPPWGTVERAAAAPAPTPQPEPRPEPGPGQARQAAPPHRRARRVLARTLVAVLVAVVLAGGWLGFGLLEARQDLIVGAAGVRAELARAEAALERGQPDAARAAMQAAHRSLAAAAIVSERREVRAAARLPVLSAGVADTRRLLAAVATLNGAGDRAVALAARLGPGRVALLRDGRFDLDALEDVTVQARGMVAELERVREELGRVRGGPFAPGVAETRRWALDRLELASARSRRLVATLEPLPAALGAGDPRRYLVVLTGPAGLRPGGGTPLAAREVVVDNGVVRTGPVGREVVEALGATGASAHFPAAGRAMAEAAAALGRPRPDGVIAIDPLAVRALLEATGPVPVPGHGRLDAAGAVRQLTGEADGRHQAALAALVARVLDGRDLLATARAVGAAGAGRNLQVYAAALDLRG
jgi:Protein of unknown function (DUF4012)